MTNGQVKMIKPKNPNHNCLAGLQCPKCGSYGPFYIEVTMFALMHDSGSDMVEGDQSWGEESACVCQGYPETDPAKRCQFAGKVKDFEEDLGLRKVLARDYLRHQ